MLNLPKELSIPENSCKKETRMYLSSPDVESLVIGDGCFENVITMKWITEELRNITIGRNVGNKIESDLIFQQLSHF